MNDEIKEILKFLKVGIDKLCISKPDFSISYNDVKILLNYITNLQHTKEYLGEVLHEQDLELEDYKSRIEKAVEYIELYTETTKVDNVRFPFELKELNLSTACRERLLNILNGRSDE